MFCFFFSSRRRHTRWTGDWSSDVCSSDLTAAKLGRLLGVDAIIIGSITQFGRDDKKLGVGGGKIGFHGIGLGGFGKKSSKATVAIDARIVNIGTGEILAEL